jgi:1A family penicillin-binding protein
MPIKHLREVVAKKEHKEKKDRKNIWITLLSICGGIALLGFFILTIMLAWISRDLPNPNSLLQRDVAQSTKIYDRKGETLLYEIHGDEQRTLVQIKDLPDYIKNATVAIEDKDFYKHHGISWKGLIRAVIVNTFKGKRISGTSTLTQQFVKNAILTNERSITRKLKEVLLSLQIERKYTKDEILQLYLNEIPYGSTMYGIESAAQGYLGKPAKELTLDEAALLVSIPQSPDTYNPYGTGIHGDNRETLVGRQRYVLTQMVEQGYISKEEAESAKSVDTLAKLVPLKIGNIKAPHFVMMVRAQLVEQFGQRMVETGGLKVITTLDWDKQQMAEKAVTEGVDTRGEKYGFTNAGLVSLDPKTGQILAMVGSKDYYDEENDGQVNIATRPRQPGSSFKPIVYAEGFVRGYLPETTLWDVKTNFKTATGNYSPNNYSMNENGPVSIRQALQGSLNIPAVKMLYLAGVDRVLDLADALGYTTLSDRSRYGLSLVLGGGEVKLLEHVSAYGSFATEGIVKPTASVLSVEQSDGTKLSEWKDEEGKRVFEPQIARLISNVLSDNNARAYIFGTNNSLTLPGRSVAAKTGTTNDYHDAWTLGYTPSLVTGVWVGNMDNAEMKRGADGSIIAAPIWKAYMTEALKGTAVESFTAPAPAPEGTRDILLGKSFEQKVNIDALTGKLATEYTPAENIIEKSYRVAHDTLYYVNRENPTGPAPERPEQDPQFNSWEGAVQAWAVKTNWSTTGTGMIPTEYDDVHTKDSIPQVLVLSPEQNERIYSREAQIRVSVTAPRSIQSVNATLQGYVIGSTHTPTSEGIWTIQGAIPNAIEKGFQDILIEALDDVGNKGKATITVNLLSEAQKLKLKITKPSPNQRFTLDEFPQTAEIEVSDLTDVNRADLYLETPSGNIQLIGSNIQPKENPVLFNWSYIQGPGIYKLYAEAIRTNGEKMKGDGIQITVAPAKITSEPIQTITTSSTESDE